MKVLIRILFGILNGIVFCAFVLPGILTASEKGNDFSSHFWSEPFTWIVLSLFLSSILVKFYVIRKIRKKNLHFKFELGSQSFWFLVRACITGIWISWIANEAVFSQNMTEGVSFIGCFIGLILIFYWMYYGRKMRRKNDKRLDETLAKVMEQFPSASQGEISQLRSLLLHSELYNRKDDSFSQVVVGSPARSFVVRNRTKQFESVNRHGSVIEDRPSIHGQTWKEWKFYFCVLIASVDSTMPGLYSKSDFLSLFDNTKAEKYDSALSQFKVTSIEISRTGYVIGIEPGYNIGTMGIKVPTPENLNQLFLAFEK